MIIIFSPDDDLPLNDFIAQRIGTERYRVFKSDDQQTLELLENGHAQPVLPDIIKRTANSRDKIFLDKVIGIIEQRIIDQQLSVEDLSRELAMSRSSLHKKLKALSGHVPNQFIRIIRLKKAAQLILLQEYNISEISYLAGFNSHSYFSKCFISHFKMSPSEFLKKQKGVS